MPGKQTETAVFNAADLLARRKQMGNGPDFPPPQGVVLCLQPTLFAYGRKQYRTQKAGGFRGEMALLKTSGGRVALMGHFGLGAPVVGTLVEELAAFGVRQILLIGLAGGLQPGQRMGDLVLCAQALRDEGTSHHYLPSGQWADAHPPLLDQWQQVLTTEGDTARRGRSWTTDAPYRETWREVIRYRNAGVLTVEMEAAALFAVGQFVGVETAAAFALADVIGESGWQLAGSMAAAEQGLRRLLAAAVGVLSS
ncbi:MAG: nucleoside phosphorylase [Chloroflexota bacterium]